MLKIIPDTIAVVCGLLFFPWILGVPGQPTILAQCGWNIGITTIIVYLITYQIVKSSERIICLRQPAVRVRLDRLLFLIAALSVPAIAFAVALVVLS
ncbi:hypothetical protein [Brucella thiophenivorans]|uniref:Putative membrane protein n=1 Tax=Brucella thiophenivorans TaxID=571255 RepID=A0A256EZQ6_9HYPH|nr:hypothetical protein [Brucella thiophenivorans]OYR07661.1 putative membrane protein [Brucella thiophenivorans]